MPQVSIRHLTTYRYRNPVAFGEHRIMARPMESFDQRLVHADLHISPEPSLLRLVHDVSGAGVGVARFEARARTLSFEARITVDHRPGPGLLLQHDDAVIGAGPFAYAPDEAAELSRSLIRQHEDPAGEVEAWARRFLRPVGRTSLATLLADMTHSIRRDFAYGLRLTGAPQTPLETLALRKGSCRDFAVLMIDACRSLGIAAQFVSGYVYSASRKSGRSGGGHTHAWVRAYLPGGGWCDFDPTNAIVGNIDLIRVVAVADPRHALPLYGTYAGLRTDYLGMDVEVEITVQDAAGAQPNVPLRVALPQH